MYISGLIQRDALLDLGLRWLADELLPGDARFVTQVFVYESLVFTPTALGLVRDINRRIRPGPMNTHRVRSKDEVRLMIMDAYPRPDPRSAYLFERYRQTPEEFFPRTPVDCLVGTRPSGELIGFIRIKAIQRIAEKTSRRIADRLAGEIDTVARSLAQTRADMAGVPLSELISSRDQMEAEFAEAERIVSQAFRDHTLGFTPQDMRIDDVIAAKFVDTPENLERLERAIAEHPLATLAEREVHCGTYNAVNLLVDLELPPPERIIEEARGMDWRFAAARGLDPHKAAEEFGDYVRSGARTFRMEVILTTIPDLVESEFGRAMHEERILAQRHSAPYSGRIARNASYIIRFLLVLAMSPTTTIESIPIKMWGRYLPDTLSMAIDEVFGKDRGLASYALFANHPLEMSGIPLDID
jgi:hypothetical protein